jgi:hypothetical protein
LLHEVSASRSPALAIVIAMVDNLRLDWTHALGAPPDPRLV